MKKSGSIVRKILFFNIFTSVSIVLIFTVLYMVFSSIELKKDMEARSEAVGTSSASTLDVVAENCLNTLAKIEYDKNLQTCLAAVRSGETETAKAKILLRDIIDDNIALNYVFLGLVVTGDGGETKYQSSALTVPEEIVAEAKDKLGSCTTFFFVHPRYENFLFLAQRFYLENDSYSLEFPPQNYSVCMLNSEIFFNSVLPSGSLLEYKMNVSYGGLPVLTESALRGKTFECENGFRLEICVPQNIMPLNPLNVPRSYLAVLLLAGIITVSVNIINNMVITKPIKQLSEYCEKIPRELDKIPEPAINGKELKEITVKINGMIDNLNRSKDDLLKKEQDIYAMELEKQQISLDMLYSQINSHFLYNTLSNIRGMALKHSDAEVADALHLLVKYFRYCTDQSNLSTVEDESSFLDIYLKIQTMRFGKANFSYEIECEQGVEKERILRMLLQPLAENCFAHGFKEKHSDCRMKISVSRLGKGLQIVVTDNGVGCEQSVVDAINNQSLSTSGAGKIGIGNIRKRLQLYYPDYSLTMTSDENGTSVTVSLGTGGEKTICTMPS